MRNLILVLLIILMILSVSCSREGFCGPEEQCERFGIRGEDEDQGGMTLEQMESQQDENDFSNG